MQNILLILCEVCYLNGESGLLSGSSASSLTFSSFFCGSVQSIDVNCFKFQIHTQVWSEEAGFFVRFFAAAVLYRFPLRS